MIEQTSLSKWWQSRANRERKILKLALPIIMVLLLALLFTPLLARYSESKYHHETLVSNYQWLQTVNSTDVSKVRCNGVLGDLKYQLQQLPKITGLAPGVESQSYALNADGSYSITLKDMDGQQALAWIEQLPCSMVSLKSLELVRASKNKVNAKLRIELLL